VFGNAVDTTTVLNRLLPHNRVITIRVDRDRPRDERRSDLLQKTAVPTPITSGS